MTEALSRLEEGSYDSVNTIERADILEYLAFSNYMQGHVRHALGLTDELIELRPDHQRALGNKAYYEEVLNKSASTDGRRGEDGSVVQSDAVQKVSEIARNVVL